MLKKTVPWRKKARLSETQKLFARILSYARVSAVAVLVHMAPKSGLFGNAGGITQTKGVYGALGTLFLRDIALLCKPFCFVRHMAP